MASPGAYRDVEIRGGTDAEVAAQMADIDASMSPPANTIKADQLGSTPSPYQTFFAPPTASVGLAETATSLKDAYIANTAKEADALAKEQEIGKKEQVSIIDRIAGMAGKKSKLYEEEGVNKLKKEVDDITAEMAAVERSYEKRLRAADENEAGLFGGGVGIVKQQINKDKAEHLADLAITLNAKTNSYDTAKRIVDDKVNAQTEEMKIRLDGMRYFYEENSARMSDKQKTLLQEKITAADREYEEERDLKTQIGNLQLEAAKNGAPVSVVRSIGQAKDVQSAIAAGGGYMQTPQSGGSFDLYTDEDTRQIFMSGLSNAPERTKMIFLNTKPEFRQAFIRNASGGAETTPENLIRSYEEWEAQQGDGGEDDIAALKAALQSSQ